MWIKRLYIGEFGTLRNQTLDNLNSGLVVVGGLNRAGKSTFMKVLKHLGYGFSQGRQLPPQRIKYQVEGDLVLDGTNDPVQIRLEGMSDPIISKASSPHAKLTAEKIYPIDAFTYRHLYTITLDQLVKIPEGIENRDVLQLQSVLLGAGLSDIAAIPQLEQRFIKEAGAIGGKTGNISNKGFKPYVDRIKEGIDKKKKALEQVELFSKEQSKLASLEQEKDELQDKIQYDRANADIIDLVRSHFDIFEGLTNLKDTLAEHKGKDIPAHFPLNNLESVKGSFDQYKDLKQQRTVVRSDIENSLERRENTNTIIDLLIMMRTSIESFYNRTGAIKEKINNYIRLKRLAEDDKSNIVLRLKRLNWDWTNETLEHIQNLPLNIMEEDKLVYRISRHKELADEMSRLEDEESQIQANIKSLSRQQEEWQSSPVSAHFKTYLTIFIVSALAGVGLYTLFPVGGIFVGLFGILGAFLFVLLKGMGQKEVLNKLQEIEYSLMGCEEQWQALKVRLEACQEDCDKIRDYFTSIKQQLGIRGEFSPDFILEYYKTVTDLQERVAKHKVSAEATEELWTEISSNLGELGEILWKLNEGAGLDYNQTEVSINNWDDIQEALGTWHKLLKTALDYRNLLSAENNIKAKLERLMGEFGSGESVEESVEGFLAKGNCYQEYLKLKDNKQTLKETLRRNINTDRIKKAVGVIDKNNEAIEPVEYFFGHYHEYSTQDEADRHYYQLSSGIQDMEQRLEHIKKEIQTAKDNLKRLALTTELESAHKLINSGRRELYPVAYRYAVLKTASWLCSNMKETFLDKMKDELLSGARDVLGELTSGIYNDITPGLDLSKPDFFFSLEDGTTQDSVDVLSRGTQEQVFLAVRLGRIMDIEPALPIIVDDSFVNFDPLHLRKGLEILCRLSKTHQIFLMTCHPHVISLLQEIGDHCQYWRLEQGEFANTDSVSLMEHLKH